MTELKKNNKRSVNETNSKPSVKKFKSTTPGDNAAEKKFKPKTVAKKFDGKKSFDGKKYEGKKTFDGKKYEGRKPYLGKKPFDKEKQFGPKKFDKNGANPQAPAEKTNWNELKQKKKDLKIQRRKNKSKDLYDIDVKAKKIYEELKM